MGDTERRATGGEVRTLRQENSQLKDLVAALSLKNVMLKKAWPVRAKISTALNCKPPISRLANCEQRPC